MIQAPYQLWTDMAEVGLVRRGWIPLDVLRGSFTGSEIQIRDSFLFDCVGFLQSKGFFSNLRGYFLSPLPPSAQFHVCL